MNDEFFLRHAWRICKKEEHMATGHLNTALHQSTRYLVERPSRDSCARAHRLVLSNACRNWAHWKANVALLNSQKKALERQPPLRRHPFIVATEGHQCFHLGSMLWAGELSGIR